jgi:hypothetical protein
VPSFLCSEMEQKRSYARLFSWNDASKMLLSRRQTRYPQ